MVIDAQAIILRKKFAAESVGWREDGGHRRYYDSDGRSGEGRAGGAVGGRGAMEGDD